MIKLKVSSSSASTSDSSSPSEIQENKGGKSTNTNIRAKTHVNIPAPSQFARWGQREVRIVLPDPGDNVDNEKDNIYSKGEKEMESAPATGGHVPR